MKKVTSNTLLYPTCLKGIALFLVLFLSSQPANSQNISFDSAIVDAVNSNQKIIASQLIANGVSPNEVGKFKTTPLHRAAFKGYGDIVDLLLQKGASANMKDFGGATPLHMAARKGNIEVVRKLIKNGADLNIVDNQGFTPLQRAISSNNTAIGVFLLEAGADVDSVGSSGNTPLIEAVRKNNETLVEEIVLQGANVEHVNDLNLSAYDYAVKSNRKEILDKLSMSPADIKRQRALKGNNVIIVSDYSVENRQIPEFLENKVGLKKIDKVSDLNPYTQDLDVVGSYASSSGDKIQIGKKADLPWLNKTDSYSSIKPVSSLKYSDLSGFESSPSPYSNIQVTGGNPAPNLPPNMPVVKTAQVVSYDNEITEDEISDILGEGNNLPNKRNPSVSVFYNVDDVYTKPVEDLKIYKKQVDKPNLSRTYDNIGRATFLNKSINQSVGSTRSNNAQFKIGKNEVDYSNHKISALPASLKMKYFLGLPEKEHLKKKVMFVQHQASENDINYVSKAYNPSNSFEVVDRSLIKVQPVSISTNIANDFSESSPVESQINSNYKKSNIVKVEKNSTNSNLAFDKNISLLDKKANSYLSRNTNFKNLEDKYEREIANGQYDRRRLINNINNFYNDDRSKRERYDLSSLQKKRLKELDLDPSKDYGFNRQINNDSYPANTQEYVNKVKKNSNPFNIPKSQIYRKAIEEKSRNLIGSNTTKSKIPAFLLNRNKNSINKFDSYVSKQVIKDKLRSRAVEPASMNNSQTKTDSLLSWEGFSNDDVDELYNKMVLGIDPDFSEVSRPNIVQVDTFPTVQAVKDKSFESDIVSSGSVGAVPVQVSAIETLKPTSKIKEGFDSTTETEINLPDYDNKIPATSVSDSVTSSSLSYDSLQGNHSIIGGFSSTDDAVSYFNSISSRLGFAYNHKIIQARNDGKYYIAIGRLESEDLSNKLCKAYESEYIQCQRTRFSNKSADKYQILKVKKVYSILGEFASSEEAKLYFSKNIASKNVNYKVAKAGSSDIYLLQLGPLPDGLEAKRLCGDVSAIDQKCKVAVK